MAMSGSKRRNRAASAWGQEADIAVLAIDLHSRLYGNPWFSVQPDLRDLGEWGFLFRSVSAYNRMVAVRSGHSGFELPSVTY